MRRDASGRYPANEKHKNHPMKSITQRSINNDTTSINMKTVLSGLLLAFTASLATAADSPPPNIVLILSDDQSYTDYSFMGHPAIETPNPRSARTRERGVPPRVCPNCPLPTGIDDVGDRTVLAPKQDNRKQSCTNGSQCKLCKGPEQTHQRVADLAH